MKSRTYWQNLRDFLAVCLSAVAALCLYGMATGELSVDPVKYDPTIQFDAIRAGLEQYCSAFGLILLLVGVAFVLVGYNDKVETAPSRLVPEDED